MGKFKVNSIEDNKNFLITDCYKKLCKMFESLKLSKGKIVHVVGAPGTGKSANIYSALNKMDLNVYNIKFNLEDNNLSSKEVFNKLFESVSDDLGVGKEKIYEELSQYDAVLFADSFHDSHFLNPNNVGFSQWTDNKGFSAFYFYLLCVIEYLRHRRDFKKINIVLQTAWRIYINGKKYDIFTDLGILSRIIVNLLKILFDVVEISYSEMETINIVKMHVKSVDEDRIKPCIQKYGCKPRFICDALEK
jgi:ABC-type dipeptide/oligopeptide/nickel transport system ATPase component